MAQHSQVVDQTQDQAEESALSRRARALLFLLCGIVIGVTISGAMVN